MVRTVEKVTTGRALLGLPASLLPRKSSFLPNPCLVKGSFHKLKSQLHHFQRPAANLSPSSITLTTWWLFPILRTLASLPCQTKVAKGNGHILLKKKKKKNLPRKTILYKFSLKFLIFSSIFRKFRFHRRRENVWNKFRKQSWSHLNPLCEGRKRSIKEII